MRVVKQMEFEAAHLLTDHDGRCANLHGHSYLVRVGVIGERNEAGMIMDFSLLKHLMHDVIDPFDHAFIYDVSAPTGSAEDALTVLARRHNMRRVALLGPATAENIAEYIHRELETKLPPTQHVEFVQVHETSTSYAEVGR